MWCNDLLNLFLYQLPYLEKVKAMTIQPVPTLVESGLRHQPWQSMIMIGHFSFKLNKNRRYSQFLILIIIINSSRKSWKKVWLRDWVVFKLTIHKGHAWVDCIYILYTLSILDQLNRGSKDLSRFLIQHARAAWWHSHQMRSSRNLSSRILLHEDTGKLMMPPEMLKPPFSGHSTSFRRFYTRKTRQWNPAGQYNILVIAQ